MSLIPFRTKRSLGMEPASFPTSSLTDFRNEMNRLFEGFFNRPSVAPGWFETIEPGRWLPTIDMAESDETITPPRSRNRSCRAISLAAIRFI